MKKRIPEIRSRDSRPAWRPSALPAPRARRTPPNSMTATSSSGSCPTIRAGGYDEYTRVILPYFEKYSGARVDIINMPGSGGMKGAVEIFNSPADGNLHRHRQRLGPRHQPARRDRRGRLQAQRIQLDRSHRRRPQGFVAAANSGIESFEGLQGDGEYRDRGRDRSRRLDLCRAP